MLICDGENHRKMEVLMGKPEENHRKTIGKWRLPSGYD
jgi:hypothetical protein